MDGVSKQPSLRPDGAGGAKAKKFLPFDEALLYARSLNLKSEKEWRAWCKSGARLCKRKALAKRDASIPSHPEQIYRHNGWQGYGHWLGTGNQRRTHAVKDREFLPFKKALLYAHSLKLKSSKEWLVWCKCKMRPANIPATPEKFYKRDGWQGYGHWLGTGNIGVSKDQTFLPFKEALLYARSLRLKSLKEWQAWCKCKKRPANIPAAPEQFYKRNGWQGYGHWLGTGNVGVCKNHEFLPFKKALLYARSLTLKSQTEWKEWRMTSAPPANIPSNPHTVYKHDGWQGYRHWLGTGSAH